MLGCGQGEFVRKKYWGKWHFPCTRHNLDKDKTDTPFPTSELQPHRESGASCSLLAFSRMGVECFWGGGWALLGVLQWKVSGET